MAMASPWTGITLALAIAVSTPACQSAMSVEEAKKVVADLGGPGFVPPPRTAVDIDTSLEQAARRRTDSALHEVADAAPPSRVDQYLHIPAAVAAGQYYVIALLDDREEQAELDETNNLTVSAPFSIVVPGQDGEVGGVCGALRPLGWKRPAACGGGEAGDGDE
jgi:hypothetical protein